MKTISIDIETYSGTDLNKCGVYKYTEDPDFEVLLFGYAVDGGEVHVVDLALGELTTGVTARGTLHVVTEDGATVDNPYLTLSQTSVGVTVPVYIEREIPITVGTKYGYFNEDNTRITVSPKSLTVRADPALLEGVDAFEIATIDEKKISGNETQIVAITLPAGVENLSLSLIHI